MKTASETLREVALKHSELKTKMEEIGAPTDIEHIEAEKRGLRSYQDQNNWLWNICEVKI